MSATLGAAARERLLARAGERRREAAPEPARAVATPYPLVSFRQGEARWDRHVERDLAPPKRVAVRLVAELDEPRAIASRGLAAARAGARVLVVRDTVSGCLATQEALEEEASRVGAGDRLFQCLASRLPTMPASLGSTERSSTRRSSAPSARFALGGLHRGGDADGWSRASTSTPTSSSATSAPWTCSCAAHRPASPAPGPRAPPRASRPLTSWCWSRPPRSSTASGRAARRRATTVWAPSTRI